MNEIGINAGVVVLAYFLGSIPFGYIISKKKGIPDIREMAAEVLGGQMLVGNSAKNGGY